DDQRCLVLCVQGLQHGIASADRFFIGQGMATMKITKAADMKLRRNRTSDDAFEPFTRLLVQSSEHRVRRFANGNYEQTTVCVEIVKVFANPEDATFAMQMPYKRVPTAGLAH